MVLVLVLAGDTLTIYGLAAAGGEAGRDHGIMGRRFPDGGLLRYKK